MTRFSPDAPPRNSSAVARQPVFFAPPVLVWTLGALWIAFAVFALAPRGLASLFEGVFALMPAKFLAGPSANGGPVLMVAPLFGHMFVHADFMHVLFNSLWLLAFGAPVVRRLASNGMAGPVIAAQMGRPAPDENKASARASGLFLGFFLLCGAAGALAFVAANPKDTALLVGASGGVSGLLGALVRFAFGRPNHFVRAPQPIAPLGAPSVWIMTSVIVGLNLATGVFGVNLGTGAGDIAWEAHLGGYFFGLFAFPLVDRLARA